jgi:hypothetical protein
MADSDKRLRYYNGQFLREQDFIAEQEYHLDRQREHNRQLHTPGIADGLTVTADVGASSATVTPGTAIDGEGRVIVLTESRPVQFRSLTGSVLVVISYDEQPSDPATSGDEGDTRWWESPDVEVIAEAGAPPADLRIRLARLQIAANGTVSQHDTTVRNRAAARLATGNLKVPNPLSGSLQIVQDQNETKSPMMIATTHVEINTDSTRAPVLTVAGNIPSTAMMEVRNQKNEASIRYLNLDNADKVAWHVGTGGAGGPKNFFFWNDSTGPVGKVVATITPEGNAAVTGNLSVAGNVLVPGTVDGRDVSADGQKLDIHVSSTNNPHNTTAAQVGAITGIGGVSNPGGNIGITGAAGITITPDNAARTITIANAAGNLKAQSPLGAAAQFVQDQGGNQSPLAIGTTKVGIGTKDPGYVLTVAGNIPTAPLAEVRNQDNEASIRYVNSDGMPWHVGSGGMGGAKNFFFWNQQKGIVATITPEGKLTIKGDLVVEGGLSMRRAVVTASFNQPEANGTIKTVETGFQPKLISMEGRAHAWLGPATAYLACGGAIGGFCHVSDSGVVVRTAGHGPHIFRLPEVPFIVYNEMAADSASAFGSVAFIDHLQNPKLHIYLEVVVESITSTGFRLKLVRRTDAGFMPPSVFGVDMAFAVLG